MAEYVFVSCFSNKFGAVRFSRNPEKSLANSCGFDVLFRYSVIYANLLGEYLRNEWIFIRKPASAAIYC